MKMKMKTKLLIPLIIILGIGFSSCKKDDSPTNPKLNKSETITLGAAYVNDVYYSLSNGLISTVPRANWDIAFSVSTRSSSIIINEGAGVVLKMFTNTWSWDGPIDTTGYSTWTTLHNSNLTWEDGAFNQLAAGGYNHTNSALNYGWGDYDMASHNINGVTKYIIKLRDGSFKKLFIEQKNSVNQKYVFRFANMDGSSPVLVPELLATGTKANYVYYSLTDNSVVTNREPDASTWDLLFTKWIDNNINYSVTGVLQNIGVSAIALTVDNPANVTYTDSQFVTNINTIGSNWKTNDPITHLYTIPTNKTYIVKNVAGKVYQITFTGFEGSSTGVLSFNIKEL